MWFIFDNLQATIIGSVVIIMLLTAMQRVRELNLEQLSIYSAKVQALDLAEWMENDLSTLGTNFDSTTVRFSLPQVQNGNTTDFTFYRDTLGVAFNKVRIETRYQLIDTDTVEVNDSTIQMHQIIRSFRVKEGNKWTKWQEDGRSSGRLSYFMISLLGDLGQPVDAEAETIFFKMDLSVVPPFLQGRQYLSLLSWGSTIRLRPY